MPQARLEPAEIEVSTCVNIVNRFYLQATKAGLKIEELALIYLLHVIRCVFSCCEKCMLVEYHQAIGASLKRYYLQYSSVPCSVDQIIKMSAQTWISSIPRVVLMSKKCVEFKQPSLSIISCKEDDVNLSKSCTTVASYWLEASGMGQKFL